MPLRNIGLPSGCHRLERVKRKGLEISTFASTDQIILIVVHYGRKLQMRHGTSMAGAAGIVRTHLNPDKRVEYTSKSAIVSAFLQREIGCEKSLPRELLWPLRHLWPSRPYLARKPRKPTLNPLNTVIHGVLADEQQCGFLDCAREAEMKFRCP